MAQGIRRPKAADSLLLCAINDKLFFFLIIFFIYISRLCYIGQGKPVPVGQKIRLLVLTRRQQVSALIPRALPFR